MKKKRKTDSKVWKGKTKTDSTCGSCIISLHEYFILGNQLRYMDLIQENVYLNIISIRIFFFLRNNFGLVVEVL